MITRNVVEALPELRDFRIGMLQVFIQHTSASLTINENADPDVRVDMEIQDVGVSQDRIEVVEPGACTPLLAPAAKRTSVCCKLQTQTY